MTILRLFLLTFLLFAAHTSDSHAQNTAPESAFKIKPGDILQVTVWKEEGMDQELVVLPDGTITFPLVGTIQITDMTTAQVTDRVKKGLSRSIPDASVSVIVKAPLGHTVNVIGQVAKPGEIIMGRRMTVMQALSQAGGLTPYANGSRINILRKTDEGEISMRFSYNDVSRGRRLEQNIILEVGDVIVVPTAGLF